MYGNRHTVRGFSIFDVRLVPAGRTRSSLHRQEDSVVPQGVEEIELLGDHDSYHRINMA